MRAETRTPLQVGQSLVTLGHGSRERLTHLLIANQLGGFAAPLLHLRRVLMLGVMHSA